MAPWVAAYYFVMPIAARRIAMEILPVLRDAGRNCDVIHHVRIGREPLALASLALARERKIPFVLTPIHHPRWAGWRYRLYQKIYAQADLLLALTEAEKKTLISLGVERERVLVTGAAVPQALGEDGERFRREYSVDGPIVLFVGQHYRYKGWRELLDSAPLVWTQHPSAHFVFVGPAVRGSERTFAAVGDRRILRLGPVDSVVKNSAIAASDVVCLPSTQESFGMVFLEAWAAGKPVIGCPIPAVREVVDDGVNGLLVDQKADQLGAAIIRILAKPDIARAMGQAGRRKCQERWSLRSIASKTEAALADLVRASRQQRR